MTESNAEPNHENIAQDHWERSRQEAKQAFTEASKEAKQTFHKVMDAFSPPGAACDHFRQSRIEFLKGMRELIDHQINRLSNPPQRGTRVTVE